MKDEKTPDKPPASDVQQLQELYDLMLEKGLDALELKNEETHIRLNRKASLPSHPVLTQTPAAKPEATTPATESQTPLPPANTVVTPLAGVFYRASSPTNAPYVKDGDTVDAGQTLCIIEAMKVMNEIKASSSCRIVKIMVENARPVTAGQALFQVEPL